MTPQEQGPYGLQGHGWQDLLRQPLYIATDKISKLWALWFRRRRFFFYVFPIVSLWELMTPGAGSFLTTIHCYTQNMKALGLVVSEKKFFFM